MFHLLDFTTNSSIYIQPYFLSETGKNYNSMYLLLDRSPDHVSTAIKCRKATGNQCASVSNTSLKTQKQRRGI